MKGFVTILIAFISLPSGFSYAQSNVHGKQKKVELSSFSYPIQLQSKTSVSLWVFRSQEGKPVLQGKLRDDRNKGVAKQEVLLSLPDGNSHKVKTDSLGQFRFKADKLPRKGQYQIRFNGSKDLVASQKKRFLDLGKVDMELKVNFPSELLHGTESFEIQAHLSYGGKALQNHPLTLFSREKSIGQTTTLLKRKKYWPLMTLRTNPKGLIRFLWRGEALQGPARNHLLLKYKGNQYFLPQEHRSILIISAPIVKKSSGKSFWALLLGLAILLIGFAVWKLQAYFLFREEKVEKQPRIKALYTGLPSIRRVGYEVFKFGSKEDARDFFVGGQIWDGYEDVELPNVLCFREVEGEDWVRLGRSDWDGHFLFKMPKEPGQMKLRFLHSSYKDKVVSVQVPHQGQGRRLRIYMQPYRQLIFELYRKAVSRLSGGKAFDLRRQTPREILEQLPKQDAALLLSLSRAFEEAYYAPREPKSEDYECVRVLWDKLEVEKET